MDNYLEIGKIVNSYGLKGFIKVLPLTDNIKRYELLKTIFIDYRNNLETFDIEEVKYHKNFVLLKLKGIDDINQVEKYKESYIKIDRKDGVKLPKDAYYIVDLIGLNVETIEGEYLGKIDDIIPTGSNDVYVVKNELGKQILIPAIKSVVKEIDIENKKVKVHLIEGLV